MLADIISGFIGLIGVFLLSYGAYLIAPKYGFITLGLTLMLFSFLLSRANAMNKFKKKKK